MGFFKKVFRPVRKIAKKIIPKEIRPALPFLAATYLGPAGAGTFSSGIKAALQRGLIGAGVSAATDEDGNPLRAGILAATPGLLSETAQLGSVNAELAGMGKTANLLSRTSDFVKANEGLKTIAAQTGIDSSAKLAEINQDEIDKYNENLRKQGVLDKTKRRSAIFSIYKNAGYDDDYVNSMLDRYGYESGGITRLGFKPGGKVLTMEELLEKTGPIVEKIESIEVEDDDEEEERPKRKQEDLATGLQAAAAGVEKAFGRSFGNVEPVPMLRFAQGGEVEIEEETDDLGIMDFMRDQGIEYGEQASYGFDDAMSESFEMFQDYRKRGIIPLEMEFDEFLEIMRDTKKSKDGIMQMASGYKDDIEEMYEQYVFEMEEQGLQPMSFSDFLRQARSGMAKGGMMKGPDWFTQRVEDLMYQGLSYEEASEQAYNEGPGGGYKDGGKAQRRKKGEPADEVIETEQEIFIDKMPRPRRRQGIMEAADGGIMEKDMRGGGFIPEGSKERADDVPARLSKNEFVMTADAVRAAGGGSVNKGAKRMYDMMYNLEGKV